MTGASTGEPAAAPQREEGRHPSRARRWIAVLASLAVLALLVVGGLSALLAYNRERSEAWSKAEQQEVWEQAAVGSWPDAKRVLDDHAAALLRGDEKGWLSAVDPERPDLREHYRQQFSALRELGVSNWSYNVIIPPVTTYGRPELDAHVTVAYCLHVKTCPVYDRTEPRTPTIEQRLSLTRRGGAYVITDVRPPQNRAPGQTPWESSKLTFAQGKRVTIAAPPSQVHRLREVVAAADRAAVIADRYAKYVDNPQLRYRIYLAGDAEWKTWFGAAPRRNAAGYAIPIGLVGTEVVLRMSTVKPQEVFELVRHELGHVATLSGSDQRASAIYDIHEWLVEGVAEYISFAPKGATSNPSHNSVRAGGRLPDTLAIEPLSDKAKDREVSRFYALGHHAVSCLVDRFGEPRFFDFLKRVLRQDASYDEASRAAFDRPWRNVDRDCVSQIRRTVR